MNDDKREAFVFRLFVDIKHLRKGKYNEISKIADRANKHESFDKTQNNVEAIKRDNGLNDKRNTRTVLRLFRETRFSPQGAIKWKNKTKI